MATFDAQGTSLPDAIFVCTRREDVVMCIGVPAKEMHEPDMRQGPKAAAELCAKLEDALDKAHGATRAVLHEVRARGSCQSCWRPLPA